MADWLIFWSDFSTEKKAWPPIPPTKRPFGWWRTSNKRLKDNLQHGDRLWLFTSGKLCGHLSGIKQYQTFLPQILSFDECVDNIDYRNPKRSTAQWKYRVIIKENGCFAIDPPLLVEDIIFSEPRKFPPKRGQTAGERLQTPRILSESIVKSLEARLKANGFEIDG